MVSEKIAIQRLNLLRREYVSIMAPENEQLARIKSLRPDVIYGYTSSLRILAEQAISKGFKMPQPKILVSSAELLDPPTRRLLTQAFGVEPVDFYGSIEFGWIAWQCPHRRGYHINSDCLIVECLKNGVPAKLGEEGELVITNLHSDAAPLIRYMSGDTGVMSEEKCRCGRNLPILVSVNGRLADCLVLPDGRKVSPYTVTCAIEEVSGVSRFRVVQESPDKIAVQLLGGSSGLSPEEVRRAIEAELGSQVKISVDRVDSLPTEPNGKFKVVRSLVQV
jgi:phenylacetate-CoA ligase